MEEKRFEDYFNEGETISYLGKDMVITRIYERDILFPMPDFCRVREPVYGEVMVVEYLNFEGVVVEKEFYHYHLEVLIKQNNLENE